MESLDTILKLAVIFFIVTNPIGNSPTVLALVKDFDFDRQKKILIREGFFALIVALFFQYFGEAFLGLLNINDYALTFCGGVLLFLVSLGMIFSNRGESESKTLTKEPFFVPIATPLLSGPGLMTIIMLKSKLEDSNLVITLAILLAWVGILAVLILAPYLQKALGKRGMMALEQLMGMILAMIGTSMLVKGGDLFIQHLIGKH